MPSLSPRLQTILDAAGPCDLFADVCSDHAQLALAAVSSGLARRAVAIELRQAPLIPARRSLHQAKLGTRVLLVRGAGLQAVARAEVVVVAGVGGDLAAQLLVEAVRVGARKVIVQPNRHGREVRSWAREAGFHLDAEQVVQEGQRLHLVLSFARRAGPDPAYVAQPLALALALGPRLLAATGVAERLFVRRELERMGELARHQPGFADVLRALEAHEACQPAAPVRPLSP